MSSGVYAPVSKLQWCHTLSFPNTNFNPGSVTPSFDFTCCACRQVPVVVLGCPGGEELMRVLHSSWVSLSSVLHPVVHINTGKAGLEEEAGTAWESGEKSTYEDVPNSNPQAPCTGI